MATVAEYNQVQMDQAQVLDAHLEPFSQGCILVLQMDRKVPCNGEMVDVFGFELTEEQVFKLANQITGIYSRAELEIIKSNPRLDAALKAAR